MSKIEDTYRIIALEYINSGFNNIQDIYSKYHPNCSEASLKVLPYNLLENIRFKGIKDKLVSELMDDKETRANECLNQLHYLSLNAKKETDKINASTSFLKFTKGEKTSPITINLEEQKSLLQRYGMQ